MPWYLEIVDQYGVKHRVEFTTKSEAEAAKAIEEEKHGDGADLSIVWSEVLLDVGVVDF